MISPNSEIYVQDENGKKTTIMNSSSPINSVDVSPKGDQLAYSSKALGFVYIYTMNMDGSNVKKNIQ